ncbi:hypothetical protein [Metapseudomonas otitidis]|uniref:hypothetical protein n=1 Tax=Metapseudomonas otitidis TaxID=319939 RepID=UPI0013F65737|nr:hypothetical protein [Pseudomonas otitidis]
MKDDGHKLFPVMAPQYYRVLLGVESRVRTRGGVGHHSLMPVTFSSVYARSIFQNALKEGFFVYSIPPSERPQLLMLCAFMKNLNGTFPETCCKDAAKQDFTGCSLR